MAVTIVQYGPGNTGTADTSVNPSPSLWGDCPWDKFLTDGSGITYWEDFTDGKLLTSFFTATQATQGTFAYDTTTTVANGVALADCASSTAAQGINVQADHSGFLCAAGTTLWFEARCKIVDAATGPEFYMGLSDTDTAIITSSAVGTENGLGFSSVTDDNVLLFFGNKADVSDTTTSPKTLVDGTYVKLGFKVEGVTKCTPYVDGVPHSDTIATASIPVVQMRPSFVCQSGGTTDPILHIDWIRVAQNRA